MSSLPAMTGGNCSRRPHRRVRIAHSVWNHPMTDTLVRDHIVTIIEALERLYGVPYGPSIAKETDRITRRYRAFIEAARFFAVASAGPEGMDCSPRGDAPRFVRVSDEK